MNWFNPKLNTGGISNQDFQVHWVTITALHGYRPTGELLIDVSSWGSIVSLNFNDVWNNASILGYAGLVYFVKV